MTQRITLILLNSLIPLFCLNLSFAQTDSLSNDDIIKYFENKDTATIYFTKKALKKNNALRNELSKHEKKQKGVPKISVINRKMGKTPNKNIGVHYDYRKGSASMYDIIKRVKTGKIVSMEASFDSASFISMDIQHKNVKKFITQYCLPELDRGTVYIETGIEICLIEFPGSILNSDILSELEQFDTVLFSEIQKIDTTKVNNFYFFDSFQQPNQGYAHGESVKNIIIFILDHFHASKLQPKVKSVSLDFFDDRDHALGIITDCINMRYGQSDIKKHIKKRINYYKIVSKGRCTGLCMPSDYLNILLDYHLMQEPEIISMSFYMKTPYPVFCYSIEPNMKTNLLGAVLNNIAAIEDLEPDYFGRRNEPMFTLKSNILETGTMLVGAVSEGGSYDCLFSKDGHYVSTLGRGYWNSTFECSPIGYGTSWATPEIAAKLFIAKAYWASIGPSIDAFEAKRRLLLSCDLDTNFVNKFASPGIPNMNKLLRIRKDREGFIEMEEEVGEGKKIYDISIEKQSKMIVNTEDEKRSLKFKKFKKRDNSFCGLYYEGDNVYIFQESKWERLNDLFDSDITNIEFKNFILSLLETNKTIEIETLEDLRSNNINQIVIL